MSFICPKCGEEMKRIKKETVRQVSYRVLIVKTETKYKCPNNCALDRQETKGVPNEKAD